MCVLADPLRSKWRDGRFRLRLTAEYPSAGVGDFRAVALKFGPAGRWCVLRDGRRIGSVRLRYRDGAFRGRGAGPKKPPASIVFRLVSLTDGAGNRYL